VQPDLSGSNLSGADLYGAMMRGCLLERARLEGANLSRSKLIYSNCSDTNFRNARFMWANTIGSTFEGADFSGAKKFFLCREILVEILKREMGNDFERVKLVGAIAVGARWCYPEWKQLLESQPQYRDLALEILQRYPDSGFNHALRTGWRPPAPGEPTLD
jgi:hypothetical protein